MMRMSDTRALFVGFGVFISPENQRDMSEYFSSNYDLLHEIYMKHSKSQLKSIQDVQKQLDVISREHAKERASRLGSMAQAQSFLHFVNQLTGEMARVMRGGVEGSA